MSSDAKITDPARFCVNCAHAYKLGQLGEWYCRVGRKRVDLVTGEESNAFCEIERDFPDRCGPNAINFKAKEVA